MTEHPLTTAWRQADASTRMHWIDDLVDLSKGMERISAKNAARRKLSEETGIPYEELLRRENEEYAARRNAEIDATVGSDYWNARKHKKAQS